MFLSATDFSRENGSTWIEMTPLFWIVSSDYSIGTLDNESFCPCGLRLLQFCSKNILGPLRATFHHYCSLPLGLLTVKLVFMNNSLGSPIGQSTKRSGKPISNCISVFRSSKNHGNTIKYIYTQMTYIVTT